LKATVLTQCVEGSGVRTADSGFEPRRQKFSGWRAKFFLHYIRRT